MMPRQDVPPSWLLAALLALSGCATAGSTRPAPARGDGGSPASRAAGVRARATPPTTRPAGIYEPVEVPPWAPVRGPRDAKVTVVLFSDFDCDVCALMALALERVRHKHEREVRIAFRHQPQPQHPRAAAAASAAAAAHAQGRFWEMHDRLFDLASRRGFEFRGNPIDDVYRFVHGHPRALSGPEIEAHAAAAGIDLARFHRDLARHPFRADIESDEEWGQAHHAAGAPAVFINGMLAGNGMLPGTEGARIDEEVESELRRVDAVLAERGRTAAGEDFYREVLAGLPGSTPDRPPPSERGPLAIPTFVDRFADIEAGGSAARGPEDAPITIIEYADFQCPPCAAEQRVLKALEKEYPGKLRIVYKHQPLPFHLHSLLAAEAAMAAGAQGRFWPMHDRLYAHPAELSRKRIEQDAAALGLDMERFRKDLSDGRFREPVEREADEGFRLGAEETPTFFVNGWMMEGAPSEAAFEHAIERELAKAGRGASGKRPHPGTR